MRQQTVIAEIIVVTMEIKSLIDIFSLIGNKISEIDGVLSKISEMESTKLIGEETVS